MLQIIPDLHIDISNPQQILKLITTDNNNKTEI